MDVGVEFVDDLEARDGTVEVDSDEAMLMRLSMPSASNAEEEVWWPSILMIKEVFLEKFLQYLRV